MFLLVIVDLLCANLIRCWEMEQRFCYVHDAPDEFKARMLTIVCLSTYHYQGRELAKI